MESRKPDKTEVALDQLPLSYLAQFVGLAAEERVLDVLEKKRHGALRPSHGYLVQHLLGGPRTIGELAQLLGVTQQAVSKRVQELSSGGYLEAAESDDARVRRVALSARGQAAVQATRDARQELDAELEAVLGERRFTQTRQALIALLQHLGAEKTIRQRRIKPSR